MSHKCPKCGGIFEGKPDACPNCGAKFAWKKPAPIEPQPEKVIAPEPEPEETFHSEPEPEPEGNFQSEPDEMVNEELPKDEELPHRSPSKNMDLNPNKYKSKLNSLLIMELVTNISSFVIIFAALFVPFLFYYKESVECSASVLDLIVNKYYAMIGKEGLYIMPTGYFPLHFIYLVIIFSFGYAFIIGFFTTCVQLYRKNNYYKEMLERSKDGGAQKFVTGLFNLDRGNSAKFLVMMGFFIPFFGITAVMHFLGGYINCRIGVKLDKFILLVVLCAPALILSMVTSILRINVKHTIKKDYLSSNYAEGGNN